MAVIIYIFIVAQGNKTHEYYQLPIALPACVFIGKSFNKLLSFNKIKLSFKNNILNSSLALIVLLLILVLSYSRLQSYLNAEDKNSPIIKIANDVRSITNEKDYVIIVSNFDPVYLYHCNRTGWNPLADLLDSNFIKEKINHGAKWLAAEKNKFKSDESIKNLTYITDHYQTVINRDDYYIIKLTQ